MDADNDEEYPTVGHNRGETVDAVGVEEDMGDLRVEVPDDVGEMLEMVGMRDNTTRPLGELGGEMNTDQTPEDDEDELAVDHIEPVELDREGVRERVEQRLPAHARLRDNGELWVDAEDSSFQCDTVKLNQTRRAILKWLAEGKSGREVAEKVDVYNSYVYRVRSAFNFLLEDDVLYQAFIESGGEFAPAYVPEEASDEDDVEGTEDVETDVALDMFERGYDAGQRDALREADGGDASAMFDGDEWWEIMKVLMEHGEDEYARRIASEIDFN